MGEMSNLLNSYVEGTTKAIVDKPNEVIVTSSVSTKAIIIQIKVNANDIGKIIGKGGRTTDALRVLCLAIKNTNYPEDSRRIVVEVLEDENSQFSYK